MKMNNESNVINIDDIKTCELTTSEDVLSQCNYELSISNFDISFSPLNTVSKWMVEWQHLHDKETNNTKVKVCIQLINNKFNFISDNFISYQCFKIENIDNNETIIWLKDNHNIGEIRFIYYKDIVKLYENEY